MKTIILDFDGTIADTRNSIIETVQATLSELHLPLADHAKIKELIGLPLKDTFEKAACIDNADTVSKAIMIYRKRYDDISLKTVKLFPNVKETLQLLYEKGTTITVASSKGKDALNKLLERLDIKSYITFVFGEQDVIHKKPAPDMALHILEATKSKPDETLVVGDTVYDIAMGQGAKCLTCGVTYGNHSRMQLQQQKADYIIDDFKELSKLIS